MTQSVKILVKNNVISINITAENQFMKGILLDILKRLKQEFLLNYKYIDIDLSIYEEYFTDKQMSYKENDNKKFFVKKLPELVVENINDKDIVFISENWSGSFERSDIILVTKSLQKSVLLETKLINPYDVLKDPTVFFVITDGDDPDEYSSFAIYMRQESFPFVYRCIISGIESITKK